MNKDNKYVKYLLLAGVLAVWGIIGWRVISGLGQGPASVAAIKPSMPVRYDVGDDSFTLRADYPDPFLPVPDSSDAEGMKGANGANGQAGANGRNSGIGGGAGNLGGVNGVKAIPPEPLTTWLQFNGLVRSGRKKVAIVTMHGTGYLVKEKDKVQGVLFVRIDRDGIRVRYQGESYSIHP